MKREAVQLVVERLSRRDSRSELLKFSLVRQRVQACLREPQVQWVVLALPTRNSASSHPTVDHGNRKDHRPLVDVQNCRTAEDWCTAIPT